VQAVGQQAEGVDGELVLLAQRAYLPKAVGVVGFVEKDGFLVTAFAHQVVRVAREQKAILAGHNSPLSSVFLGSFLLSLPCPHMLYEEGFSAGTD
jgi:hypothetical protein